MPNVIFEQLQYPALSPTRMCLQLADSTIRYPKGIVENLLVRVKNSFILIDLLVLDMEGDLGVQLILGRTSLRDARARIDVGIGEIHFRIGVDNMHFKFQHRDEQSFVIHQDHDGSGIWGEPLPQPGNSPTTPSRRRRTKRLWRKVGSVSSSTSPRRDGNKITTLEKSPAHRTLNTSPHQR
jgi:hypothetical protein